MTALMLKSRSLVETVKPKALALYGGVLRALDAFAEARMRKANREIDRYRRLHPPVVR